MAKKIPLDDESSESTLPIDLREEETDNSEQQSNIDDQDSRARNLNSFFESKTNANRNESLEQISEIKSSAIPDELKMNFDIEPKKNVELKTETEAKVNSKDSSVTNKTKAIKLDLFRNESLFPGRTSKRLGLGWKSRLTKLDFNSKMMKNLKTNVDLKRNQAARNAKSSKRSTRLSNAAHRNSLSELIDMVIQFNINAPPFPPTSLKRNPSTRTTSDIDFQEINNAFHLNDTVYRPHITTELVVPVCHSSNLSPISNLTDTANINISTREASNLNQISPSLLNRSKMGRLESIFNLINDQNTLNLKSNRNIKMHPINSKISRFPSFRTNETALANMNELTELRVVFILEQLLTLIDRFLTLLTNFGEELTELHNRENSESRIASSEHNEQLIEAITTTLPERIAELVGKEIEKSLKKFGPDKK